MDRALVTVIRASLLVAPAAGALVALAVRRAAPAKRTAVLVTLAVLCLLGLLVILSPWSLRGTFGDACLVGGAYFAACSLGVSGALLLKRRLLRVVTGVAIGVPVAIGYLLGTVGVLAVYFAAGDLAPTSESVIAQGVTHRTYSFGNAATSTSGWVDAIYVWPVSAPFVEHRIWSASSEDGDHATLTVDVESDHDRSMVVIRKHGHPVHRVQVR